MRHAGHPGFSFRVQESLEKDNLVRTDRMEKVVEVGRYRGVGNKQFDGVTADREACIPCGGIETRALNVTCSPSSWIIRITRPVVQLGG